MMAEVIERHTHDMDLIVQQFSDCDNIQERLSKLSTRISTSNKSIAQVSEREKKLAVFLVELNNKLFK